MAKYLTLYKRQSVSLEAQYRAFLLDRQASRCTPKTLEHYRYTVGGFVARLQEQGIDTPESITPALIRAYLVSLQDRGLADTTQHAHARGLRTWLNWLVSEGALELSPMARVKMPRLEKRILAPFSQEDIARLLAACNLKTPKGLRDYALLLTLLDSGMRAAELLSLRVGSVNMQTGLIVIMGKGRKQRTVIVGAKTRKSINRYLETRDDTTSGAPLWAAYAGDYSERGNITTGGLGTVLHRIGRRAGVLPCGAHRFRRTFALWCMRSGMDLESLRRLMGHSDLTILQRYLSLDVGDLERAHRAHSPVDKIL